MKNTIILLFALLVFGCQAKTNEKESSQSLTQDYSKLDTATFAGGCFWCVEASFDQIKGVASAVSGYAGGSKANADYQKVSSGRTKHTETVQIYFDPAVISYETLLEIFFTAHDGTQLNRQGPDVGTQYRSAIFYHDQTQKQLALAKITELQRGYDSEIVTQINPYTEFYIAEEYHQDYEEKHPFNPYIMNVSRPKIEKVQEKFADLLKEEE